MRKLQWTAVASLLLVSAGFPLFQALHEWLAEGRMPHVLSLFAQAPGKESLHRWDDAAKDGSVFAKWLRPHAVQLRYDLLGEMGAKSIKGREDWLFYRQDVEYLVQPPYSHPRFYKGSFDTVIAGKRVNLRNPLTAIADFRDRLRARGIELLVVPIPGKPSIYPERLEAGFPGLPPSPTLAFLADLEARGFRVVDLFAPMREAKASGAGPLYLRQDTHWTPAGVDVAAAAVAEGIRRTGCCPDGDSLTSRLRYALRETEARRWGDIAEMTKIPSRRSIWGEEKVAARQVWDERAGKPYHDEEDSPVLWLGDSFSRIYQTDAPRSAGIIAHVARRLNRPLASVVNDGGASTVVRQQLLRKGHLLAGKKLVVWTFVERDIRFGAKGWQVEELP